MILLDIAMVLFPPVLAWIIHIYLRRGSASRKKKAFFFLLYFLLINIGTFSVSYLRGVKKFDFRNMTLSYKLKYLGLGSALACIVSFFVFIHIQKDFVFNGIRKCAVRFNHRVKMCISYTNRFFKDIRQYFHYAVRAAKADLRAEVANSFLDWLWWLIEPFCMMLIYSFIFGTVLKASELYFPIFIFTGLAMFSFFSRGVTSSVEIVRGNRAIITKIYLPKYILLFSRMLVNGFKMLVSFGVVIVMMIFFKVPVTINILCFFPIIVVLFLFTFGLGSILMHYGVYVSDLSYIVGILMNMLMYLSGIFYSISKKVPAPFGELLEKFNPVAFLISSMRNAILYGHAPNWLLLGGWAVVSLILSMLGILIIYHNENSYVKVI